MFSLLLRFFLIGINLTLISSAFVIRPQILSHDRSSIHNVPSTPFTVSKQRQTTTQIKADSSITSPPPPPPPQYPLPSLTGIKSLGVDYGTVRTGVAVTVGYAPHALTIVTDLNSTQVASQIVQLAHRENATQIVLGLPLHKNGTISEQANITLNFASVLACACHARFGPKFEVFLWDERYTTKEAAARMTRTSSGKVEDLTGILDAESACIILEHFYNSNGENAARVRVPDEMRDICDRAWEIQQLEKEREQRDYIESRQKSLNARKEAMERARTLEEQMVKDGLRMGRKKDKKKKRKKRTTKWVDMH